MEITYRDARLRVDTGNGEAALYINGMRRDSRRAGSLPCQLHLTSTLQTDYEWHEFIEARVHLDISGRATRVELRASNTRLALEEQP